MRNGRSAAILGSGVLVLFLLAGTAFAGPVLKFGPNDEGLIKFEYKGQFSLTKRDTGSGADRDDDTYTFNFRRQRFAIMGAWGKKFSLYVNTDYSEDQDITAFSVGDGKEEKFRVIDAVFRFKLNDKLNLWAGKFKYSTTRENLESCEKPLSLDRSIFIHGPWDEFNISRDEGVSLWGNLFENKFQYRLDVMEGRSDSGSAPKSQFRYGTRVHVTLLDPEKGHGYKGTYLGKKKVLTIGAAYQFEPDVAFEDNIAKTGSIDYSTWTADLFFEYPVEDVGTFTFSTAYADFDFEDVSKDITPAGDSNDYIIASPYGEKDGFYVKAGYMLPNLPLQFFARAEKWDIDNYFGILDQEAEWYGGGFNYYFRGQNLKLTMEYNLTDFDKETNSWVGPIEDYETVTAQLQVIF